MLFKEMPPPVRPQPFIARFKTVLDQGCDRRMGDAVRLVAVFLRKVRDPARIRRI